MNILLRGELSLDKVIGGLILEAERTFLTNFETLSNRMSLAANIVRECELEGEINPLSVEKVYAKLVNTSSFDVRKVVSNLRI